MRRQKTVKCRELRRQIELDGLEQTSRRLRDALDEGLVKPQDFSVRDLAESLITGRDGRSVGRAWVQQLGPQKSGGVLLAEAVGAVDTTAFSNITGQIIYSTMMESYLSPQFVFTSLCDTIPTNLNGEKIPGVTQIADANIDIEEQMPIPELGFAEDYIETPSTKKQGFIVSVTKEAIFFDRTGLVMKQAADVGSLLGLRKEKKLVRVAAGLVNNYKWKGTSYNTYLTSGNWVNKLVGSSYEFVDYTDIDAAEQLFADLSEPNTGEPIMIQPDVIVHTPAYKHAVRRALRATELRTGYGTSVESVSANTLDSYTPYESRLFYRLLQSEGSLSASAAKKYWLIGQPRKAFAWMQNWPLTVVRAPDNSEAEFTQDISMRFKATERGVAAVLNPRYMVLVTGQD